MMDKLRIVANMSVGELTDFIQQVEADDEAANDLLRDAFCEFLDAVTPLSGFAEMTTDAVIFGVKRAWSEIRPQVVSLLGRGLDYRPFAGFVQES